MILKHKALLATIAKIDKWWGYFEDDMQPPSNLRPSEWDIHSLAESAAFLLTLIENAGIPYVRPDFPYMGGIAVALKELYPPKEGDDGHS